MRMSAKKMIASTLAFMVLVLCASAVLLIPHVGASVTIVSLTPNSGNVGTNASLTGNITTSDGAFNVTWDDGPLMLAQGNAATNDVKVTFVIPEAEGGPHNVTLFDITTGEKATNPFNVNIAYSINALRPTPPAQLQEGNSMNVSLNLTGGIANTSYVANVTVLTPSNASYSAMVDLAISSLGSANPTQPLVYPDTPFALGANTNFTGTYTVFFNGTLAVDTFFVGLTNSSQYHRYQVVDIRAIGYRPNEGVNVTISGSNIFSTANVTADATGAVHYTDFAIPFNASLGTYVASVSSLADITRKAPPDVQNFTIPGYTANVTMLNLAGEFVSGVVLRVFESGISVVNQTSGSKGLISLLLEAGNYTDEAYWLNTRVGEVPFLVEGDMAFNFTCSLTNIGVTVVSADAFGSMIPQVALSLLPENQTLQTSQTDIQGMAIFHSLLPNVTYSLNASRYDTLFNLTSISPLPVEAWYNFTIQVPIYTLQLNVTDTNGQAISGANVTAHDLLGGPHFSNLTQGGLASFDMPLGNYAISIYANGTILNQTTVKLNQTSVEKSISCSLYGLTVRVQVSDYFGQPISNADVAWSRTDLLGYSKTTDSSGTAVFSNVIGGDWIVSVRLPSQSEPVAEVTPMVSNSTTIQISVDKYVVFFGALVETSQLAAVLLIVITIAVLVSIEIVLRRRHIQQKE